MSNINDVTLLISTIATSLGTLFGIGLSIYTITKKEGQNFKIVIREHQILINPAPGYSPDKSYTNLRVINTGGRQLRISSAGYVFLNFSSGGIFSESLQRSHETIPIDNVSDYLADESDRPEKKIAYYYATSLTGKTRRKYVTFRGYVWGTRLVR